MNWQECEHPTTASKELAAQGGKPHEVRLYRLEVCSKCGASRVTVAEYHSKGKVEHQMAWQHMDQATCGSA